MTLQAHGFGEGLSQGHSLVLFFQLANVIPRIQVWS